MVDDEDNFLRFCKHYETKLMHECSSDSLKDTYRIFIKDIQNSKLNYDQILKKLDELLYENFLEVLPDFYDMRSNKDLLSDGNSGVKNVLAKVLCHLYFVINLDRFFMLYKDGLVFDWNEFEKGLTYKFYKGLLLDELLGLSNNKK